MIATSSKSEPPSLVDLLKGLEITNRQELLGILYNHQIDNNSKEVGMMTLIILRYTIEILLTKQSLTGTVVDGSACYLTKLTLATLKKDHREECVSNDMFVKVAIGAVFGCDKHGKMKSSLNLISDAEYEELINNLLYFVYNNRVFERLVRTATNIEAIDKFYVCIVLMFKPKTFLEYAYQKKMYLKYHPWSSRCLRSSDSISNLLGYYEYNSELPTRAYSRASFGTWSTSSTTSSDRTSDTLSSAESDDSFVTAPLWKEPESLHVEAASEESDSPNKDTTGTGEEQHLPQSIDYEDTKIKGRIPQFLETITELFEEDGAPNKNNRGGPV